MNGQPRAKALTDEEIRAGIHETWRADAACRHDSTNRWFSDDPAVIADCKTVCQTCPVSTPCYVEAGHDTQNHPGIRGGYTEEERLRIASKARRAAESAKRMERRRRAKRKPGDPVECGTIEGFYRHTGWHETPCDACHAAYMEERELA